MLTGRTIASLSRKVIGHGSVAGILADIAFAAAGYVCPKILPRAAEAVTDGFRTQQPATSAPEDWEYGDPEPYLIASTILVGGHQPSGEYILQAIDDMCADVRAGRPPVNSISTWFPGATVSVQDAMYRVLSIATRRCGLPAYMQSTLDSAMSRYIVANTYPTDLIPPVTWLTVFRDDRYLNGTSTLYVGFAGNDGPGSGIAGFTVWLDIGNGWREYTTHATGTQYWVSGVTQGTGYRWAVRAEDRAGNRSDIVYSSFLVA